MMLFSTSLGRSMGMNITAWIVAYDLNEHHSLDLYEYHNEQQINDNM